MQSDPLEKLFAELDEPAHPEMFPQAKGPVVVKHGRTFRQCRKCHRLGWYPQATAEICCGAPMIRIDHPSMTVEQYVRFIGCPNAYKDGSITEVDLLAMMEREGIEARRNE